MTAGTARALGGVRGEGVAFARGRAGTRGGDRGGAAWRRASFVGRGYWPTAHTAYPWGAITIGISWSASHSANATAMWL